MASPSLTKIINGTVDVLKLIDGIGDVVSKRGGRSTWSKIPKPEQSYWIVDHYQSQVREPGTSLVFSAHTSSRYRRIVVEGWMPWSEDNDTTSTFRDRMDDVLIKLTNNLSLGVCAKNISLPELDFNRLEFYTSLNKNDVPTLCHHCRIGFTVVAHYPVLGEK